MNENPNTQRQEVQDFAKEIADFLKKENQQRTERIINWLKTPKNLAVLASLSKFEFEFLLNEYWKKEALGNIFEKAYTHAKDPNNFPAHIIDSKVTMKRFNDKLTDEGKQIVILDKKTTIKIGSQTITKRISEMSLPELSYVPELKNKEDAPSSIRYWHFTNAEENDTGEVLLCFEHETNGHKYKAKIDQKFLHFMIDYVEKQKSVV